MRGLPRSRTVARMTAWLVLSGCVLSACGGGSDVQRSAGDDDMQKRADIRGDGPKKPLERVQPATQEWKTGEATADVLAMIVADLSSRVGGTTDQIRVLRDEAVIWADGSMACPQPGQVYTQATVAGYWIILEYGGRLYDYRAAKKGHFVLCEHTRIRRPGDPSTGPVRKHPDS